MLIPVVAILGALIPTILYVLFVWWLDCYEKEPLWLLAFAFLWGAIPATILSALLEYIIVIPISLTPSDRRLYPGCEGCALDALPQQALELWNPVRPWLFDFHHRSC